MEKSRIFFENSAFFAAHLFCLSVKNTRPEQDGNFPMSEKQPQPFGL